MNRSHPKRRKELSRRVRTEAVSPSAQGGRKCEPQVMLETEPSRRVRTEAYTAVRAAVLARVSGADCGARCLEGAGHAGGCQGGGAPLGALEEGAGADGAEGSFVHRGDALARTTGRHRAFERIKDPE